MTKEQKSNTISFIIASLRCAAQRENKAFDTGSVFFSLCFKTDEELKHIANLCN